MRARSIPAVLLLSALAGCDCGGVGVRPAESVLATPPALDFGDVPVGTAKSLGVKLSVSGVGEVDVVDVKVSGDAAFTVGAAPDAPLASGAPATLTVTFRPTVEGPARAVLHVSNDSVKTAELDVQLTGNGVGPPSCDDGDDCTADSLDPATGACVHERSTEPPCDGTQVGPGGGRVGNCDGENGSPSCDIVQVPVEADAGSATAACPAGYVLIGCGFLCDDGADSGGTEMVDETTCRADCRSSTKAQATAFCYRGDASHVVRVEQDDVPRDTVVDCPGSHPQVLGCTSRCVDGDSQNNPGGATLTTDGEGCQARCDIPGDSSPQLVVYCGDFPNPYSQVVRASVPSGSDATCPAHTTLAGGLGMCVNGKTGGFIATDSRQYVGYCNDGLDLDQLAAFCLGD